MFYFYSLRVFPTTLSLLTQTLSRLPIVKGREITTTTTTTTSINIVYRYVAIFLHRSCVSAAHFVAHLLSPFPDNFSHFEAVILKKKH